MSYIANFSTANLFAWPADGKGAITAKRANTSGATTTFTTTTVSDSVAWTLTGFAAGDLVITQDGFWGIAVSTVAGPPTVVTVDYWRKAGFPRGAQHLLKPTDGQTSEVHSKSHAANGGFILRKLILLKGAATTFAVTDISGVALTGGTFTVVAAQAPGELASYGEMADQGLNLDMPLGILTAANTIAVQMVYDLGTVP